MLRAQLKRISLVPIPRSLTRAGSSRRRFLSHFSGEQFEFPPVPVLRPTLWAIAATATIVIGCAAYDVRRDVQAVKRRGLFKEGGISSYEDLEYATRHRSNAHNTSSRSSSTSKWFPSTQISTVLAGYTDAEKFALGAAAFNMGLVGASSLAPGTFIQYFGHTPALSPNYTLLTSAFGHSGLLHAGINSFVLLQFGPQLSRSHIFEGNGSHFAAFYLSAGILSSLGDHLATILPTRKYKFNRFIPALGASGVINALFGAWGTLDPDARVGMFPFPGSFAIRDMMAFLIVLEMYGLIVGFPLLSAAHAAHLSGLGIGVSYVYFDGANRIWRPTRRSVFNWMKRLKMV
ncbi:rhomboid family-domain-containing protein [Hypoxylon sp. FL0890]|nr:rhomboid family-domain-containing protein [Hypoxylon sp. FL0890]